MSETLTWANPIETEKIRTHHAKIVVECTTGHPYYSIEYFDPADKMFHIGYSSYNIENVRGWLSECFEIVEAPKTNADRIRAMTDEELAHELALVAGWDREQYKKSKAIGIEKVILDILRQPCEEGECEAN